MTEPRSIIEDIKAYVGFSREDAEELVRLGPRITPSFSRVVDRFYAAVEASPGARSVFSGPEQISRLKRTLHVWLAELFGGTYDEAYFDARARIGRTHVRVGLEQRYMVTAMNVVRTELEGVLHDVLAPAEDLDRSCRALHRICDIDLAIMLETYREDYVFRRTRESESLAAMGRLTAGLAHEIRNPLNAAKLQLDVLERNAQKLADLETKARVVRRVELVQSELERLSALLDDFLNLARPTWISPEPFDMRALLDEVRDFQGPVLDSRGIGFAYSVDEAVGEVVGERHRVRQVLGNLLSNAVEALERRPDPRVELRAARVVEGGVPFVEISVTDNGPGIPRELVERVFDSFVTTKSAGTGLGLTVVKKIVEMHSGTIRLLPAAGGGTRAEVRLPVGGPDVLVRRPSSPATG